MQQTVLMIDDSKFLHDLVKVHLESEEIYFESAYSGSSGLDLAGSVHPDLILLDVDMPDMNGFDVCRFLKADPGTAHIPIIFLTASSSSDEKICGMDLQAADYVTKPFNHEELAIRVREVLQKQRVMEVLSAGNQLAARSSVQSPL